MTDTAAATERVITPLDPFDPRPCPGRGDPAAFYTKPLETWKFRELHDALGTHLTAEALATNPGNVRMLRHRGAATIERMRVLQNVVRANEQHYRDTLVTKYATGAFQRRA